MLLAYFLVVGWRKVSDMHGWSWTRQSFSSYLDVSFVCVQNDDLDRVGWSKLNVEDELMQYQQYEVPPSGLLSHMHDLWIGLTRRQKALQIGEWATLTTNKTFMRFRALGRLKFGYWRSKITDWIISHQGRRKCENSSNRLPIAFESKKDR